MPEESPVTMDAEDLVASLSGLGGFPYAEIAEAEERRGELLPLFRRELERFVAPDEEARSDRPDEDEEPDDVVGEAPDELGHEDLDDLDFEEEPGPVALIFHLLARWR